MDKDCPIASLACAAADFEGELKSIRIVPDGTIESKTGTFTLDAESAAEMIGEFDRHGVEIPIDIEHSTLEKGAAPAAGWITKLSYEKGRGVIGAVRWNKDARETIRGGGYQYLSPVVLVRKSDGKAVALHSAGLTNKPAIPRMEKLAASERAANEFDSGVEEGASDAIVAEIATALALEAKGSMVETLRAIRDKVKTLTGDQEVASSVRTALGLSLSANKDDAVKAITELTALKERESERDARSRLEVYIKANKLNPNDTRAMEAALFLAKSDPDRLDAIYANATPYAEPGRTSDPGPAVRGSRNTVIASAVQQYNSDAQVRKLCGKEAFVNNALREKELPALDAAELKAIRENA